MMKIKFIVNKSLSLVTIFVTAELFFSCNINRECRSPLQGFLGSVKPSCEQKNGVMQIEQAHQGERLIFRYYSNKNIESFKAFFEQEKNLIYTPYQTVTTPYPGFISNRSTCSKEMLPTQHSIAGNEKTSEIFQTYANQFYALGICDVTQAQFRTLVGVTYCHQKKAFYFYKWYGRLNSTITPEELHQKFDCL